MARARALLKFGYPSLDGSRHVAEARRLIAHHLNAKVAKEIAKERKENFP